MQCSGCESEIPDDTRYDVNYQKQGEVIIMHVVAVFLSFATDSGHVYSHF